MNFMWHGIELANKAPVLDGGITSLLHIERHWPAASDERRLTAMTHRLKKLLAVIAVTLGVYFGLYFISVSVTHIQVKSMDQSVPQYRPWDSELIHTFFGLAQTLDSGLFRPVHWQDKAH